VTPWWIPVDNGGAARRAAWPAASLETAPCEGGPQSTRGCHTCSQSGGEGQATLVERERVGGWLNTQSEAILRIRQLGVVASSIPQLTTSWRDGVSLTLESVTAGDGRRGG